MHAARDVDAMIAAEWALDDLDAVQPLPSAPRAAAPAGDPAEAPARPGLADEERLAYEEEIERMRAELERASAEAYERGFEEGRRLGEQGEAARLRHAVLAAESALDELREGEMRWTGSIEENICALAVAVARQVIGRELREDVEGVVELVRRAMAEFPIDQPIRIRVHPVDLSAIESTHRSEGGSLGVTRDRDARWLPDARITPGGCVVEGRDRIVDGRVDTALERIYRRLTYTNA